MAEQRGWNQVETLKLKNIIIEMKSLLDAFNILEAAKKQWTWR